MRERWVHKVCPFWDFFKLDLWTFLRIRYAHWLERDCFTWICFFLRYLKKKYCLDFLLLLFVCVYVHSRFSHLFSFYYHLFNILYGIITALCFFSCTDNIYIYFKKPCKIKIINNNINKIINTVSRYCQHF